MRERVDAAAERPRARGLSVRRPRSKGAILDGFFFVLAALAAVWFAVLLVQQGLQISWNTIWITLLFWLVLAYLVLPRIHRILTYLYVPDYFIGRARTSDGLLGDPVNIALLGTEAQVHRAMEAARWTRADDLSLGSGIKIVTSTLSRRSYDEAPVSPLLLFGRQQDFAYQQEVEGNPAKRHHVRFWKCPDGWLLPGGIPADWLAAGTFDRAVGFSLFTLQITHKIEADTDIERDFIVDSLRDAESAVDVRVIEDFSTGYHARNGGGDAIVTDGNLPIVDLTAVPVTATEEPLPPSDSRLRRPWSAVIGAALVLIRAILGALVVLEIVLEWDNVLGQSAPAEQEAVSLVLTVGLVFNIVVALLGLIMAILVFAGSNWARILVMSVAVLSLLFQFIDWAGGGEAITLDTNLVAVTVDILLLLALSNDRTRDWARRKQTSSLAGDLRNAQEAMTEARDELREAARYRGEKLPR